MAQYINSNQNNDQHKMIKEYKGMFYNDEKKAFYESGAHFSYRELVNRLKELTKSLSPDRIPKSQAHKKTKSSVDKILLVAIPKQLSKSRKKKYESVEKQNTKLHKTKKLLIDTLLSNGKEELPSIPNINTEIPQTKVKYQLKQKKKLNPLNNNKIQKKQLAILNEINAGCNSRNNNGVLISQRNNNSLKSCLSFNTLGRQLTERGLIKIHTNLKNNKFI